MAERGLVGVIGVAALIGMLALFNIWWFVFVVGVLIAIFLHELGHFMTARWTGMKATQFFIGSGRSCGASAGRDRVRRARPAARRLRPHHRHEQHRRGATRGRAADVSLKSYPRRMLVITAGSVMHMLIAIMLLFAVYAIDGEVKPTDGVQVHQVLVASPAANAGLRPTTSSSAIDGQDLTSPTTSARSCRPASPATRSTSSSIRDGRADPAGT